MMYRLGVKENLQPFTQQLIQVFFVGLMIGLQRTVIPTLAETEFGVVKGSLTALFAIVVSFGVVKGMMNFVSGQLSDKYGRRNILIWGWIFALPIPFIILYAPNWNWIIFANVLLGINQGLSWSMTVTAKMDIVKGNQRGFATGINEFAGYGGVALAGLFTGYLASWFDPRFSLFVFALSIAIIALLLALVFFKETLPYAKAEAERQKQQQTAQPTAQLQYAELNAPANMKNIFALVSWKNPTFMALSQGGSIEKFVDVLMWVLVPVFLYQKGLSLIQIGWITGLYGMVWGATQLVTGTLSDRIGRKKPIIWGFLLCAISILIFPFLNSMVTWAIAAIFTGIGMALLYPTLIAAMGDIAHPSWRGSALGVYRFWRDLGYAFGALTIGLIADYFGFLDIGFYFTSTLMLISAIIIGLRMKETHPQFQSSK